MFRALLVSLLFSVAPLQAQSARSAPPVRSGSTVRLLLRSAPSINPEGAVLGRSGDTLRVVTPELGLAEVPLSDLVRLEVPSSTASKTNIVLAASAAGGAIAGLLQGGDVAESLVGGTAMAALFVLPATASERRRWTQIDPAVSWRDEPGGALVRVSAPGPGFKDALLRLHDFRAGTLYLDERGVPKPTAAGEITSLELSIGLDRKRGVAIGSTAGAIAGVLYGASLALGEGGDPIVLLPTMFVGLVAGTGVGGLSGYLLAPRGWRTIPLAGPAPPRP